MSPEAKALLAEARKRIVSGWTKDASARDSSGLLVPSTSSRAVCWCLVGAIGASKPKDASILSPDGKLLSFFLAQEEAEEALAKQLQSQGKSPWLGRFNDSQTSSKPVLALIDSTLAAA